MKLNGYCNKIDEVTKKKQIELFVEHYSPAYGKDSSHQNNQAVPDRIIKDRGGNHIFVGMACIDDQCENKKVFKERYLPFYCRNSVRIIVTGGIHYIIALKGSRFRVMNILLTLSFNHWILNSFSSAL